jgi:hypothetical protein
VKQEAIRRVDRATELHELPSTARNHLSMKKSMVEKIDGSGTPLEKLADERAAYDASKWMRLKADICCS